MYCTVALDAPHACECVRDNDNAHMAFAMRLAGMAGMFVTIVDELKMCWCKRLSEFCLNGLDDGHGLARFARGGQSR